MSVPMMAFAEDGHTISVKSDDTHTYKVFQVLTGTLSEAGSKQLGDPAWGDDAKDKTADVNAFIDSLQGKTDSQVAELVAAAVNTSGNGQGSVSKGSPLTGLATGYYVLVDETQLKNGEEYSLHVVKVVNDINGFEFKYDTVGGGKEITGDTLGAATAENPRDPEKADTDNVSVGDTVFFKMSYTVPTTAAEYDYYYFILSDKMDEGLTFNKDATKVVVKSQKGDANPVTLVKDRDYTYDDTATDDYTFRIALIDAKNHAGETITVEYSAVLNEKAKIGETSNDNTSKVTYSNNPNNKYDGTQDNKKPGFPAEDKTIPTNETVIDKTETYTTAIELKKVDENGNVLTGAEFTITGDSTEIVLVSKEEFREATTGETAVYYKLKGDKYTKDAPVTSDSMEKAAAGATEGYVVAEDNYEGTDTVKIGQTVYRPYKPTEDSGKDVYILKKANADLYEETTAKYVKTVTYEQKNTKTAGVTAVAEVGADGIVTFRGLGAGKYTITETKTPSGYNTISPVELTIGFTAEPAEGEYHWTKTEVKNGDFTYNNNTGVFETTIINNKGTELPETGGIGTTIFYVLGAILVIGAGVLLVTRRRMHAN